MSGAAGGAAPTSGNTWVHRTSPDGDGLQVGLHWLDFTVRGAAIGVVAARVAAVVGAFAPGRGGSRLYRERWDGPHGATLEGGFRLSGADNVRVSLPGEACEGVEAAVLVEMIESLRGKVTRLDVAVDGAPFKPSAMLEAWEAGTVRSGVPRNVAESWDWRRNGHGDTFYLGSTGSDRRLRVYDRRGPTRVELQLRRAHAQAFVGELVRGGVESLPELAMRVLVGFVDVAAPVGDDSNRSRWVRLPWWEAFVGSVVALRGLVKSTPATFVGLVRHVWRNASALATYVEALALLGLDPGEAFDALCQHGRMRQGSRHRAMLEGVSAAGTGALVAV